MLNSQFSQKIRYRD